MCRILRLLSAMASAFLVRSCCACVTIPAAAQNACDTQLYAASLQRAMQTAHCTLLSLSKLGLSRHLIVLAYNGLVVPL